jgi:NAD+ kinase
MTRSALLVTHTGRRQSTQHAQAVARDLLAAGFEVRVVAEEVHDFELPPEVKPVDDPDAADGVEIVLALGGDGTFLRAAELARPVGAPLLGINLGKVGFLAEAEIDHLDEAVKDIVDGTYKVDERLTLDVRAEYEGRLIAESWALNEVSVEKGQRAQMLELLVDVDGRPLARYGCDGRRTWDLPPGAKVTVERGQLPVRLVRLAPRPFTDTLVAKFALPVEGWRGNRR